MEALGISAIVVALAEVGDRTQLLALVLSIKHRRPMTVLLGILFATIANHLGAAGIGAYAASYAGTGATRWIVGLGSVAFGLWILHPDQATDEGIKKTYSRNAFLDTFLWFFVVEIGDKTEIATIGLAAKYGMMTVVPGSVLGLFAVNVPTVLAGTMLAGRVPLRAFRVAAAVISVLVGVAILAGYDIV